MSRFPPSGCQFYPVGEYLKFVRVPENLETGTEILSLEAHPRSRITITPVDKVRHSPSAKYQSVYPKRRTWQINLAGRRRRLLHLQGNERDTCFPDSGAIPGGFGGRGVAEEPIKISSLLRLGLWGLVGKNMKLYMLYPLRRRSSTSQYTHSKYQSPRESYPGRQFTSVAVLRWVLFVRCPLKDCRKRWRIFLF